MSENISIFGIRHHGPGSARSLKAALEALAPDCVLIEGPPDADSILHLAANAEMQPPVAILVYVPDQPRRSVFYPFAVFSPEWQAIRYAMEANVSVRFMDLPQACQMNEDDFAAVPVGAGEDREQSAAIGEQHRGDPIGFLAEAAGYTDSERWWDHLVEHRRDPTGVFAAVLEAITALRDSGVGFSETEFAQLQEARREAWMRQTIRKAQKEGFQKIAVVCGAWHAPVLQKMPKASEDATLLKGLPKVKVEATWIPWTHGRLTYAGGYGAGIESPGWYHHLWTIDRHVSESWMTKVAHLLRAEDLDASPASIIESVRLAETLAAMRERAIPGLAEMNEATQAVFCFGNNLPLRLVAEKLIIGEVLGEVPALAPMPPVQRDLAAEQRRLRLPAEAAQKVCDFDLRKPTDLERSHLLHRLLLLGIRWGNPERNSSGKGTFHEVWRLQWQPDFAVAVIEAGFWGNTVADAATASANHRVDKSHTLPELTALLEQLLLAGLPDAASHLMVRLQAVSAVAGDVSHLMTALLPLVQVLRYGNVRQTDTAAVAQIVEGLVARICIGLPAGCSSLDDDAAGAMFEHIVDTNAAISLLQKDEYTTEWQKTMQILADRLNLHGLIGGRATRLLLDSAIIDGADAARRMGLVFSTASESTDAASWIEGFLRGSGLLLLHDDSLWDVLDSRLSDIPADTFENLLPLLRRTFATFHAPELRQMGERARSGKTARPESKGSEPFDEVTAVRALALVERLLGVT